MEKTKDSKDKEIRPNKNEQRLNRKKLQNSIERQKEKKHLKEVYTEPWD